MAGPNTTGVANPTDYNLGRGILYAAPVNSTTGLPGAYRDLGNSPAFTISSDVETLEHLSSRSGLKVVDKEVTLSRKINCAFTLEEFNHENLSYFFSGGKVAHTNVTKAGFTSWAMIPAADVTLGRWYDIPNASGERAYAVASGSSGDGTIALASSNGTPVPLVENTDYTLDNEMGRIFLMVPATSTVVATIIAAETENITAVLTADDDVSNVHEVQALTASSVEVALKFISNNPADDGRKTEWQFHQLQLKAEGDLSLVGDDWSQMQFTGAAEANTLADSASSTITIRTVEE